MAERQKEEKIAPVWPCEPLCALFPERAAAMRTPTLLERVWASFWEFAEDERKSRIKAGVKAAALPYTSARSAGSYGSFPGDRKWGQKQKAEIAFGVTFPECLETRARSEGLAGDMHGFSAALTLRFQRGPSEIAYFSDNRSRAPCLLDSHGDMVCR